MSTHGMSLKFTEALEIVMFYQSCIKTTYMIPSSGNPSDGVN